MKIRRKGIFFSAAAFLVLLLLVAGGVASNPSRNWWRALAQEARRLLGWERAGVPLEEKRIREEIILKKMEDASGDLDWRSFVPEYPRPRELEGLDEKERIRGFKETPAYKEMEKDLLEYLHKRKDLFVPEFPTPALKEVDDLLRRKDRGAEKIAERLLHTGEKISPGKPLEENLLLGIKGPAALRKILERPPPPQVKVRVETEIELTFYLMPNGMVNRAIPSVKGDAELERIAIQYLKRWRFTPLAKDEPQVEQWGTIPVKFKLE